VLGCVTCCDEAPEEVAVEGEALGAEPTVGAPVSAELAAREPAASGAVVPDAWVFEPGLLTAGGEFAGAAAPGMPAISPLAGLPGAFVAELAEEADGVEAVVSVRWSSPHAVRAASAKAEVSIRAGRIGFSRSVDRISPSSTVESPLRSSRHVAALPALD
jgi:hypothetical protein